MDVTRKLIAVAVSALSLATAAAHADSAPNSAPPLLTDSHELVVRFSDLNLDQPRDVARLYIRVSSAAENVCGPRSMGGYFPTAGYVACYSDAVNRAVARIDRPSVSAYFRQRGAAVASRKLTFAQQ